MSAATLNQRDLFFFQPPSGGDVSLKSSDGVVFLAHSAFLGVASPVFADMFSDATNGDVFELAEDAESVSLMLRFIYPPPFLDDLPFSLLEKSLHMGQKYDIQGILTTVDYVICHAPDRYNIDVHCLRVFCLATTYGLSKTKEATLKLIQPRDFGHIKQVQTLAKNLPDHPTTAINILGANCVRMMALSDLLLDFDSGGIAPVASDQAELMMCPKCFAGHHGYYSEPYYPSWYYRWCLLAYTQFTRRDLDECDDLFEFSILDKLGHIDGVCRECLDLARHSHGGYTFRLWLDMVEKLVKEVFDSIEPLYAV